MSKCRVLTIRIDKNGAQRSASGAVFLDPEWSIPMIQIKFPPFSAKFVRLSVNLPPPYLVSLVSSHETCSGMADGQRRAAFSAALRGSFFPEEVC
jgi:hypothetical protein